MFGPNFILMLLMFGGEGGLLIRCWHYLYKTYYVSIYNICILHILQLANKMVQRLFRLLKSALSCCVIGTPFCVIVGSWQIPSKGSMAGKIGYKWDMFHCHVCLMTPQNCHQIYGRYTFNIEISKKILLAWSTFNTCFLDFSRVA